MSGADRQVDDWYKSYREMADGSFDNSNRYRTYKPRPPQNTTPKSSDPAPSPHRIQSSGSREPQLSPYNTDPESRTDGGIYHIPTDEELLNTVSLTPDERRIIDAIRSVQYGSVTVEIAGGRLRLLRKGETEKLGEEQPTK